MKKYRFLVSVNANQEIQLDHENKTIAYKGDLHSWDNAKLYIIDEHKKEVIDMYNIEKKMDEEIYEFILQKMKERETALEVSK